MVKGKNVISKSEVKWQGAAEVNKIRMCSYKYKQSSKNIFKKLLSISRDMVNRLRVCYKKQWWLKVNLFSLQAQ